MYLLSIKSKGICHGSRDLLAHQARPALLVPLEVLPVVMVVATANPNQLQLLDPLAHLALPDLLVQRESLEIQETPELQEDLDLKDPQDSMALLVDLDRLVNEAPMELQALLVDLVSPELKEKLVLMELLVKMEPQEHPAKMASTDYPDSQDPKVNLAHLE